MAGWQLEEATKLIYEQPYWTRTWIIQEIHLARRLQLVCGKKRINWHAWMWYIDAIPELGKQSGLKWSAFTEVAPCPKITIVPNMRSMD